MAIIIEKREYLTMMETRVLSTSLSTSLPMWSRKKMCPQILLAFRERLHLPQPEHSATAPSNMAVFVI